MRDKTSRQNFGYILIILSAVLFALTHVISKPLLDSGFSEIEINPIALAATVYIINGVFFTPFAEKNGSVKNVGVRNFALIGIIGVAELSGLITYFFGIKDASAINASIFSNGEIIFSLLIAITVFREKLRKNEITPFFMILFGMVFLPLIYDFHQNGFTLSNLVFGDILIILSGLFYAIDINICKFVSNRVSSNRLTQLYSFSAGCCALFLLVAFQIPFDISFEQMPSISILAIGGTGLATVFFLMALRIIGPVRTILIYSTTSVFGIIFSAVFLAESITLFNLISIILVISGIYLLRKRIANEEKSCNEPNQQENLVKHIHKSNGSKYDKSIFTLPQIIASNLTKKYVETNFKLKQILLIDGK